MSQPSSVQLATAVLDVAVVLGVGALLTWPARRLRQPAVIAEIAAGIILGPSLLGLLPGRLPERLFPTDVRPFLSVIAQVGIVLFMFLAGWELETGLVRARRTAVLGVSITSMALPFVSGALLAYWLYHEHSRVGGRPIDRTSFVLFVGTAMAITAFPVLARIIFEHRLQRTSIGALALTCAAFADVLAWCMLAVVSAIVASGGPAGVLRMLGLSALYALLLGLAVRPLMKHLVARMTADDSGSPMLLTVVVIGIFLSAYVATRIGLDAIFGGFAFGLVVPRTPKVLLAARLRVPIEQMSGVLMPVFFVVTGLSVDVTGLGSGGLVELLAVICVACFGKFAGTAIPARLSGVSWRDSAVLGTLLNTRGLTELVVLNIGVSLGVLDRRMLTIMVLMAVITTALAGPLVPRGGNASGEASPSVTLRAVDAPG